MYLNYRHRIYPTLTAARFRSEFDFGPSKTGEFVFFVLFDARETTRERGQPPRSTAAKRDSGSAGRRDVEISDDRAVGEPAPLRTAVGGEADETETRDPCRGRFSLRHFSNNYRSRPRPFRYGLVKCVCVRTVFRNVFNDRFPSWARNVWSKNEPASARSAVPTRLSRRSAEGVFGAARRGLPSAMDRSFLNGGTIRRRLFWNRTLVTVSAEFRVSRRERSGADLDGGKVHAVFISDLLTRGWYRRFLRRHLFTQ